MDRNVMFFRCPYISRIVITSIVPTANFDTWK